jgi:hypothetical protein
LVCSRSWEKPPFDDNPATSHGVCQDGICSEVFDEWVDLPEGIGTRTLLYSMYEARMAEVPPTIRSGVEVVGSPTSQTFTCGSKK